MVSSCCVHGCKNEWMPNRSIRFHRFPMNRPDILALWIQAIHLKNPKLNAHTVVCSDHFKESDYLESSLNGNLLSKDAVPSIFNYPAHFQEGLEININSEIEESTCNYLEQSFVNDETKCSIVDNASFEAEVSHIFKTESSFTTNYDSIIYNASSDFEALNTVKTEPICDYLESPSDEYKESGYTKIDETFSGSEASTIIKTEFISDYIKSEPEDSIVAERDPLCDYLESSTNENMETRNTVYNVPFETKALHSLNSGPARSILQKSNASTQACLQHTNKIIEAKKIRKKIQILQQKLKQKDERISNMKALILHLKQSNN